MCSNIIGLTQQQLELSRGGGGRTSIVEPPPSSSSILTCFIMGSGISSHAENPTSSGTSNVKTTSHAGSPCRDRLPPCRLRSCCAQGVTFVSWWVGGQEVGSEVSGMCMCGGAHSLCTVDSGVQLLQTVLVVAALFRYDPLH